jgi:asparagine synthase (glutamine-hydrolysing)
MTRAIAHRGPDGEGIYVEGGMGLGHRRLAIIDLSEQGRQPMSDWHGQIFITYNGEIYNFLEVRQELEARGYGFRSNTDTEIIANAYAEWGVDCLQRFNGMFAWGLWDSVKRRLWLVRDRLGVKPLFYAHTGQAVYFGSEIKAILAHPDFTQREIDYEALGYYLNTNWMPAPHTLFKSVRQLLPAHYLLLEADGQYDIQPYWDIHYQEGPYGSEADYIEEFLALISDSVKIRLMSDVPFGAFLSGGLDSSTVAYWMAQHQQQPIRTFSVGFEVESFDETPYARAVAAHIGAQHHERRLLAADAALLERLVWHAEEPTADSSMVAMYAVSQLAREHVTMVHSGDGGDELFAGYPTYTAHYLHKLYSFLPAILRQRVLPDLAQRIPPSWGKVGLDEQARRFAYGGRYDSDSAHALWRVVFTQEAKAELLSAAVPQAAQQAHITTLYQAAFQRTQARHPINRMGYVDTRLYLPNDMLVKVDRMTMAHGLEGRTPFLDYRLVEFAARVPPQLKLKGLRQKKYLVKAAMRDKLPPQITQRRKAGFNVPNAHWLRGELRDLAHEALFSGGGFGALVQRPVLERLLREHAQGQADHSHQLWGLLSLALWWRRFQ